MKIDSDFIKQKINFKIKLKNKDDKIKLSKYEDQILKYDIYNQQNIHYRLFHSIASYSSPLWYMTSFKGLICICLLTGIWWGITFTTLLVLYGSGIALAILLALYGSELPRMIDRANFTHKPLVTILAEDNSLIAHYGENGEITGDVMDVNCISSHIINAVLAVEDRRFYHHFGIDPIGIIRAMLVNIITMRVVQGGSTITQQLAKNLFLTPKRNIKRKIQEAMLALWLEYKFSKDEILMAYLNRVYLGCGVYGVDAAARVYYDKSARDINLCEAAMIAGLLKSPALYSPSTNLRLSDKRTNIVLQTMVDAGFLTEDEKHPVITRIYPLSRPGSGKYGRYFAAILLTGLWFRMKIVSM